MFPDGTTRKKKHCLVWLAQPTPEERQRLMGQFATALRLARADAGLTLRELSKGARLSIAYLSDVEHARRWPNRELAARIDVVLNGAKR